MSRFSSQRKKNVRSVNSEGPWKVDTPFGPPQVPRSFPNGGIRRLRNTLSKLSPSSFAEKEVLRQKNRFRVPLTHRNIDTFVTEQEYKEACQREQRTPDIEVAEWLERLY
ncbi:hypothetical protein N7474_000446 [Penicillium riverlandense]|uniref:uncharacterized protein n=1 Tax=Penicillium riverlandense TaxID=1903569 RepID=UPI002547FED4|nr:uncharacterized protein N7474_000446 [Penicillium riverlandense]KAJ5832135.1 hypothetical protein N7474_000446 [Penicillium riverlandense]